MRTFVVKLAAWHRLSKDLEYARDRLAQAEAKQTRYARAGEMREDVRRLQRFCDQALGELLAAVDAYKAAERKQSDSTPGELQPLRSNRRGGDVALAASAGYFPSDKTTDQGGLEVNDRLIGPGELAVQVSQAIGVMTASEDPTRCADEPSEIAGRNHEEANFWDEPSTRCL